MDKSFVAFLMLLLVLGASPHAGAQAPGSVTPDTRTGGTDQPGQTPQGTQGSEMRRDRMRPQPGDTTTRTKRSRDATRNRTTTPPASRPSPMPPDTMPSPSTTPGTMPPGGMPGPTTPAR